jgi:hypothetical protein
MGMLTTLSTGFQQPKKTFLSGAALLTTLLECPYIRHNLMQWRETMPLYEIITWRCGQLVDAAYYRRGDVADRCFRAAIDAAIDAEARRDRPAGLRAFRKGERVANLHEEHRALGKKKYHFAYAVTLGNEKVIYRNCQELEPLEVRLPCHLEP